MNTTKQALIEHLITSLIEAPAQANRSSLMTEYNLAGHLQDAIESKLTELDRDGFSLDANVVYVPGHLVMVKRSGVFKSAGINLFAERGEGQEQGDIRLTVIGDLRRAQGQVVQALQTLKRKIESLPSI